MLATPPPGARKVRFNYPKIVKGEILISVYWKDAKGTHTEYMPLWSLQRDYASELRQLKADLQARLKSLPGLASELQPILDLWNSGGGMPVNVVGEEIAELDDDDDDLQALVHGVSAPSDNSSSGGATVNGVGASSGGATVNGVGASSGGMTVYGYPSSGSGWSDGAEDNGAGVGIGAGRTPITNPTREELAATLQEIRAEEAAKADRAALEYLQYVNSPMASSYGMSASGGGSSGGSSENPIVIDDDEAGGTGDYFGGGASGDEVEDYGMGHDGDHDEDQYNYDDEDDFWVDEEEGPPAVVERPITPALQSPEYLEYLERKALLQKAADERSAARRARYPEQRAARAAAFDPDIDYDNPDKVEYPDYDDLADEEYYAARVAKMNAMRATARNYKESPKLSQQLRRSTTPLHIREENQRIREVQAAKLAIDLLGPRSANASGLRGRMGRAFDTTYDITRHNVDEAVVAALAKANIEFDQEDPVLLATLGSGPRAPGYTRHLQALPPAPPNDDVDDDVDYWALPNDKRHNPNRYGWDPDQGYLYHTPPAQQTPSILGTAHAQHSGTVYDLDDDDDDGDIPLVFRRRR
jgi:hypothetical protein